MTPSRRVVISRREYGFARVDLLAVLVVVIAVGGLLLLTWPHSKAKSERGRCISNLQQILIAELTWIMDGAGDAHWRTPLDKAGTLGHAQAHHAWFQWAWISNNLGSPRILVCPADRAATVASNWADASAGGFLNTKFQDAALSYFLNISAGMLAQRPQGPYEVHLDPPPPQNALAGDYAVEVKARSQACEQHQGRSYVCVSPVRPARWRALPHEKNGNLALMDGSVLSRQNDVLTTLLTEPGRGYQHDASGHLLVPTAR